MEKQEQEKKNSGRIILILLVALLAGTSAYLFFNKQQQESQIMIVNNENTELQHSLDSLKMDLSAAMQANADQSAQFAEKEKELNAKIASLQEKVKKGHLTQAELVKYKQEVADLKASIEKYVAEIAALQQENANLTSQNTVLRTDVSNAIRVNDTLKQENSVLANQVKIASALKAGVVGVETYKRKSSGKFVDTDRAKHVDKMNVSFTIVPNDLAREGAYNLYMQVIDPSGKVLPAASAMDNMGRLVINGTELPYSTATTISYVKNNSNYAIDWLNSDGWVEGTYNIKLYTNDGILGSVTFALKK